MTGTEFDKNVDPDSLMTLVLLSLHTHTHTRKQRIDLFYLLTSAGVEQVKPANSF